MLFQSVVEFLLLPLVSALYNAQIQKRMQNSNELENRASSDDLKYLIIQQRLDHFNYSDNRLLYQRYVLNDQFYREGGPDFLNVGGEHSLTPDFVDIPMLTDLAQKFGARLWHLEHRFYGDSLPIDDGTKSTELFQYLSVDQSLKDIEFFIGQQNYRSTTGRNRWVLFGCSYAGSLVAWSRERSPEASVGGVSSSAPLTIQLDFSDYNLHAQNVIHDYDPDCYERLVEMVREIQHLSYSRWGRERLTKIFPYMDIEESPNITEWRFQAFEWIEIFVDAVQYGVIGPICELARNPDPIERVRLLQHLSTMIISPKRRSISSLSRRRSRLGLTNNQEGITPSVTYADELWLWQVCTELGWFPSSDFEGSIWPWDTSLSDEIQRCTKAYDLTEDEVRNRVTHSFFVRGKAEHYNGTNIILTHGARDPWSLLGARVQNNPTMIPFLFPDGHHCPEWSEPDPYSMFDVGASKRAEFRTLASSLISSWIA